MTKDIFTKSQAVAILTQAKSGHADIFKVVKSDHEFFQLTCDQLEVKLLEYMHRENFAGVVDDPIFRAPSNE